MTPVSFSRGLWISLVSILLHDFLDLLQSTDRVPWWPFYDRSASLTYNLIPTDPAKEALLFLALFLIFVIVRHFTVTLGRNCENAIPEPHNNAHFKWVCRAMLAVIVLTATVTHYLRQVREHQLYNARLLVHLNDYYGSLKVLDRAEHWPSAAKPGRIEYLKAVAYSGLGDQTRAEQYYLRSYRINPYYFWCVADLAIFYASSERPVGERRHLVAPYLTRLQSEFTSHHYLQQILNTIKQKLR